MSNAKLDQNHHPSLTAVSTVDGETPIRLEADPLTGALLTQGSAGGTLVTTAFDYVGVSYPNATSEVYTYRFGGAAGTVIATVTVVYTDTTKSSLTSVTKV